MEYLSIKREPAIVLETVSIKGLQAGLFDPPTRKPARKLMHVRDAGSNGPGPGLNAQFECRRCGLISEWGPIANVTTAKRGIPCPKCST